MTKSEVLDGLQKARTTIEVKGALTNEIESINAAISMLQNTTIWTPCTERMPTVEDADKDGYVNVLHANGRAEYMKWFSVPDWINAYSAEHNVTHWSRIEPMEGTKMSTHYQTASSEEGWKAVPSSQNQDAWCVVHPMWKIATGGVRGRVVEFNKEQAHAYAAALRLVDSGVVLGEAMKLVEAWDEADDKKEFLSERMAADNMANYIERIASIVKED